MALIGDDGRYPWCLWQEISGDKFSRFIWLGITAADKKHLTTYTGVVRREWNDKPFPGEFENLRMTDKHDAMAIALQDGKLGLIRIDAHKNYDRRRFATARTLRYGEILGERLHRESVRLGYQLHQYYTDENPHLQILDQSLQSDIDFVISTFEAPQLPREQPYSVD